MSVVEDISISPIVKKEIICQICNKSFKRGKDLKSHSVTHTDAKPFVCSQCPEAFKHKTSLKRHSLIHSGERPFTCRVCGKSFRQKGSLNEHSFTHSGVKPHTCEVCNMGFTTKSNYDRHLRRHLLFKPFTCNICNKGFNVRSYLTRHYNKHKEIDDTINSITLKSEHKTSSAENESLPEVEQSSPDVSVGGEKETEVSDPGLQKYKCKACCKQFKGVNALRDHHLSHFPKRNYVCDICKRSFTSIAAFCKHKLAHNQETSLCEDFLNESKILPKHLKTRVSGITTDVKKEFSLKNTLDKRYICNVCNRTFLKEYQFMYHSVTHKYPGPYYCDICGENTEFEKLQELHSHYAEHGEASCICYNCFEESGSDDSNINYSTVSKCDVCHKCFSHKNHLQDHIPIHKNRRPLLIKLSV